MSSNRIPFIQPALPSTQELAKDYEQIHENNYYSNNGPFYFEFVEELEKYFDSQVHCSVVANATLGLILSLKSAAIADRKYVITPSFTFAATALSIVWAGYDPYFVDIAPGSFQLNIEQTRNLLETEDVAGIMLCNPFGIGLKNIDEWESLSNEFSVPLIIDSAAGFGSKYNPQEKVGTKGACEVFSLHATKPFGISEGGIVCSKDKNLIDEIELIKNFGFGSTKDIEAIGMNAKIPEISCAIGLRMLPHLDDRIKQRQDVFRKYVEAFSEYGINFIDNAELSSLCFASLILPDGWSKEELMIRYEQANIDVRDYYNPVLHDSTVLKSYPQTDMEKTYYYTKRMLSLPNGEKLSDENIARIISVIDEYAKELL